MPIVAEYVHALGVNLSGYPESWSHLCKTTVSEPISDEANHMIYLSGIKVVTVERVPRLDLHEV